MWLTPCGGLETSTIALKGIYKNGFARSIYFDTDATLRSQAPEETNVRSRSSHLRWRLETCERTHSVKLGSFVWRFSWMGHRLCPCPKLQFEFVCQRPWLVGQQWTIKRFLTPGCFDRRPVSMCEGSPRTLIVVLTLWYACHPIPVCCVRPSPSRPTYLVTCPCFAPCVCITISVSLCHYRSLSFCLYFCSISVPSLSGTRFLGNRLHTKLDNERRGR